MIPKPSTTADDQATAKNWQREVESYRREFKDWTESTKKILKRYRGDDRDISQDLGSNSRFNVFWASIETLKPALYARTPVPQVERKIKDADPVGRAACEVLERGLAYSIKEYDFDSVMRNVRDDGLRIGRGAAWTRYIPTLKPMLDLATNQPMLDPATGQPMLDKDGKPQEEVAYEEVRCEYVHWDDFLHDPARVWEEVRWVGRRVYMTRKEIEKEFPELDLTKLDFKHLPQNVVEDKKAAGNDVDPFKRAEICEIWDKTTRKVYWISPGYTEKPLRVSDDPLRLRNFFPCPRPIFGTLTTDTLVPLPDYAMYRDQAVELNEVTGRITILTEALRVVGLYNESLTELDQLLSGASENEMIPVKDWARFAQDGGFDGAMQFMPLREIVETLKALYERQQGLKAEIYEITGNSDIVRGMTNPNETATAQQLKGQYSTLRVSERQAEVQRFARDLIAIKAEIMAEHFSPETLGLMAGVQQDQQLMQFFQPAVILLKNDALRSFRIDIETDSTLAQNDSQEKQDRNEFIQAIGGFMSSALPMMQNVPTFTPAIGEMLLFLARGFRAGRGLENALEQAVQGTLAQMQQAQSQPPQPSPEEQKAQADSQMQQQKMQFEQAQAQAQMQLEQAKAQAAAQLAQQQEAFRQELERLKIESQIMLAREKHRADLERSAIDADRKHALAIHSNQMRNDANGRSANSNL